MAELPKLGGRVREEPLPPWGRVAPFDRYRPAAKGGPAAATTSPHRQLFGPRKPCRSPVGPRGRGGGMVDRTDPLPAMTRLTQALLRVAEDGIYLGVGLLLAVGGVILLFQAGVTWSPPWARASRRRSRPRSTCCCWCSSSSSCSARSARPSASANSWPSPFSSSASSPRSRRSWWSPSAPRTTSAPRFGQVGGEDPRSAGTEPG